MRGRAAQAAASPPHLAVERAPGDSMSEGDVFAFSLRSLKLVYWQVRSAAHSTIQTALVAAAHVLATGLCNVIVPSI